MEKQIQQVRDFHKAFKVNIQSNPTLIPAERVKLRFRLIHEELNEYHAACEEGNVTEIADALTDLLYVIFGTINEHGLQAIAVKLFSEVHRSNMTKIGLDGKITYREDGKVIKPDTYSKAKLKPIIDNELKNK